MASNRGREISRPANGAAPFFIDELFFSRTDKRGVIQSGNSVFQRVSDYSWQELIHAPHKLIRHPDMPKGIFSLMWQTIQRGEPIGAYIKNQSKDGLHYWVYAALTPIEDGYLSVLLKPSSDLLPVIEQEYAALLAREEKEGLDPAESADAFQQRLKELGYAEYSTFMAHAIAEESTSRSKSLGLDDSNAFLHFLEIKKAVEQVATETEELSKVFESIRGIPYNMRILASRLEAAGGPISVISANYGVLSEEISQWMRGFVHDSDGAFAEIRNAVSQGLFLHCTAGLQAEMSDKFVEETGLEDFVNVEKESKRLSQQTAAYETQTQEGIRRVLLQASKFSQSVRDMKRLITGLGATRMMCKIEGARLRNGGESLSGVITQLDQFQDGIEEQLGLIDDLNRQIQRHSSILLDDHGESDKLAVTATAAIAAE